MMWTFLWLTVNNITGHLLDSSELSAGCSGSTCSLSAAGGGGRRGGPAGRYRDSKYRYMLAATITEISPRSERMLHSLLIRTLLMHFLVVTEKNEEANRSSSSSMVDGARRLHLRITAIVWLQTKWSVL